MSAVRTTTYRSKRDTWLTVLIWVATTLVMVSGVGILLADASLLQRAIFFLLGLATAGLMLWILYGTFYRLTDTDLVVRSGPFRYTIPLDGIRSVAPTRSPLSGPACSLDRLQVDAGALSVLISPAAKQAFLRDLAVRSRGLDSRGGRAGAEVDMVSGRPACESASTWAGPRSRRRPSTRAARNNSAAGWPHPATTTQATLGRDRCPGGRGGTRGGPARHGGRGHTRSDLAR